LGSGWASSIKAEKPPDSERIPVGRGARSGLADRCETKDASGTTLVTDNSGDIPGTGGRLPGESFASRTPPGRAEKIL
jgi:hypothetical protein